MNGKRIATVLAAFLSAVLLLVLGGCSRAEVVFEEDGSGVCVVEIAKRDGMTREDIEREAESVAAGVKLQSQTDRLTLKKIEEGENSFTVEFRFKQIANTNGLGSYTYETGTSFSSQLTQRNLFSQLSAGTIPSRNLTNYDNSTFRVTDTRVRVRPVDAKTGETLDPDDFKNENNEYYTEDNVFFTFVLCGIEGVSSITFRFPGEILVYGDLNATTDGSDGLTVTPVKATARETGIRDGGAFSEEGEYDLFAGYVVFRLRENNTPWIAAGVVAAGIAALVALGFATGAFKRFFHGKTWGKIVKNRILYLFVLPAFVVFALFNYAPMVGIVVAFKNYTVDGGIFGSEWAGQHGFEHFITLFTHPGSEFGMIFRNTVVMAFLKFVTGFPAAIVLALMFNALKNGLFKKTAQTVSYLPYFVSWVVVSNIVYLLLSANGGILNNLIVRLGGEKIRFYSEPKYWWGILTATSLWKTVGWGTIVYLAAITAINPDLYEAASIDGAGGWRKLWTVTIPGMMPVIGIQLILNAGNMIKDDFDQIYSLVGGSNYELREVTEVFSSLVFRNLQSGVKGFSSSAAISLVQSVISLGLVLGADAIVRKTDNPGLW